jgi:hypothetical protein
LVRVGEFQGAVRLVYRRLIDEITRTSTKKALPDFEISTNHVAVFFNDLQQEN